MDESVPLPAAEYVAAVIAPLLTALVTAFGVRLRQRLQSRDERHRVRRRVHEATDEVAFIRAWCEAVQQAGADGAVDLARAREDLQEIYDEVFTDGPAALRSPEYLPAWSVTRAWHAVVTLRQRVETVGRVRYRRPLGTARAVRPLYWLALAWAVLLAMALAGASFGSESAATAAGGLGLTLVSSVLLGVLPAAALRAFVLYLDERAVERTALREAAGPATPTPPAPPPQPPPRDLTFPTATPPLGTG